MRVPSSLAVDSVETRAVLSAALRAVYGADARLESWRADTGFTEHGKRRVVRYDLQAHVAGQAAVQHCQWLGKFYDRHDDAGRVATALEELAATDCGVRGGLRVPRVVAYHAPRRLLLLTYELGEPVSSAIAHDTASILAALGRALAALHVSPVTLDAVLSPDGVIADLQTRVEALCVRFPDEASALRRQWSQLEREAPLPPAAPCFVHGDFGPANLLWSMGQVVVLDFDRCARGDPALDLGNLLAQLRRMTVRKPDRLRDFDAARARVLEAYQRWAPPDPGLDPRVAWYERTTLLRKIHGLAFNTTRHQEADALRQRHAEATRLLSLP
jgi:aminoglycoside phosphotransferase (APT) family kinase protein